MDFDNELKNIRKILKIFADPLTALRANKADDRQFAACALVLRYQAARWLAEPAALARESIGAEESKLILGALSEMKWGETPFDPEGVVTLKNAFEHLNLTEKEGWRPPQPKNGEDVNQLMTQAVSTWIKDNANKYRVPRLVAKPTRVQ